MSHTRELTDEDFERIGWAIAAELKVKKNPANRERYLMASGDKSAIGLSKTVIRIIEENGEGWFPRGVKAVQP